ncbi:MAG: FtsX-like permease family protein [Bacteroidia bacterium]|nr:FtsX-like permease family protein [Bacteroidia bacterium]
MNVSNKIARRYLFSKKSSNAINIIIWVSISGIAVGTAALILVLSVFNGLTGFIEDLFAAIDPDIKIVAAEGKFFEADDQLYADLMADPEVVYVTKTLEDRVWLKYVDNQSLAVLKGIEADFNDVNPLDTFIYRGRFTPFTRNGYPQVIMGSLITSRLNTDYENERNPISMFYVPKDVKAFEIASAIQPTYILPSGHFDVQKEYNEKYIFGDLGFVRRVFKAEKQISAYEVKLTDLKKAEAFKNRIEDRLGDKYEVLTWYEQHKTLYRVMKNEKYISYLILVLMNALTAINIVGSLSMIVLEKSRDIAVMKSFGASSSFIRNTFFRTGLFVGTIGSGIGVLSALVLGLGQKYWGFVQLQGGDSFRVKAFPVELQLGDFLLVGITVLLLAAIASLYPAHQASKIEAASGLRT